MELDFSEAFTLAAQQLVPEVLRQRRAFSFDYRGPRVTIDTEAAGLQCALHRLLCGVVDCVDRGFVMFSADTQLNADGRSCDLTITAAGTGQLAAEDKITDVLSRLQLLEMPQAASSSGLPRPRRAQGVCPRTDAQLEFSCLPSDGAMLRARLTRPLMDAPPEEPDAAAASAWLIHRDDAASDALARRLQRLGWAVSRFDSCEQAIEQRRNASAHVRKPALVVLFEFGGVTEAAAQELRGWMPPSAELIFAVAAGSAALGSPDRLVGYEVKIYPLSAAELGHITRRQTGTPHPASGETHPAPLVWAQRPLMLVVDDNELNLIVACGLVQALGYETVTACDGQDAIDQCRRLSPQVVLMDVDMPVMDGITATRQLRELQRAGEVAPFTIVAATAGSLSQHAQACRDAGMDGYLSKPLSLAALRRELRRVGSLR